MPKVGIVDSYKHSARAQATAVPSREVTSAALWRELTSYAKVGSKQSAAVGPAGPEEEKEMKPLRQAAGALQQRKPLKARVAAAMKARDEVMKEPMEAAALEKRLDAAKARYVAGTTTCEPTSAARGRQRVGPAGPEEENEMRPLRQAAGDEAKVIKERIDKLTNDR